jgi:energy-coupling factor transport system permease protein
MFSGVGLGTYQAGTSLAHRLDSRTKILVVFGLTVAAFGAAHLYYYAVITATLVLSLIVARLDLRGLARSLILVLVLLMVSSVFSTFLIPPGKATVHIGSLTVSRDRLELGVRVFFQFGTLIFAAQILTLTTPPLAIATALQRLCAPLRWVRVPVDELAMLITLALTFLPLIREQVRTVVDAQLSRGVDLRRGPLETRMRSVFSFFNPIISANLRRASDLATAMEARGYRVGMSRTHLREQRFGIADYVVLIFTVLIAAAAFVA